MALLPRTHRSFCIAWNPDSPFPNDVRTTFNDTGLRQVVSCEHRHLMFAAIRRMRVDRDIVGSAAQATPEPLDVLQVRS